MPKIFSQELTPKQWALPETLNVPSDELQARLDFYQDSLIFSQVSQGVITSKQVSAQDISLALLAGMPLSSGLLPRNALWWKQDKMGSQTALWCSPRIWQVALQIAPFQPARHFKLPMPGLIFMCSPGRAPSVFAVKKRPRSLGEFIYQAPLFNVYKNGMTCGGTHQYPQAIEKIPESFFAALFTPAAEHNGRSKKHPDNLLSLWEELDGQTKFPPCDLVKMGTVDDLINKMITNEVFGCLF